MKLQTYGQQSLLKRKYSEYKRLFILDYNSVNQLRDKGIEVYKPKLSKLRLGIAGIGIGLCCVTPFTNILIPGIVAWGIK